MYKHFFLSIAAVLLLVGGGCTGTEDTSTVTTIPELGVEMDTPQAWEYLKVSGVEKFTFKSVAGGTPKVAVERVTAPDFPKDAASLSTILDEAVDGFELKSAEDIANGYVLKYSVGEDEAFSTVINIDDASYICEPNIAAFTFEFDDLIAACTSLRLSS